MNGLYKFFATFLYTGLIPKAPGTAGSMAAIPFIWAVNELILKVYTFNGFITVPDLLAFLGVHLGLCTVLFGFGVFVSGKYAKLTNQEDPKEVVIDEVVGQWLVFILCTPGAIAIITNAGRYAVVIALFVLFRFFDAMKPWPISWFDKNIKGGLGIMVDDVAAAVFASIFFYAVIILFASSLVGQ